MAKDYFELLEEHKLLRAILGEPDWFYAAYLDTCTVGCLDTGKMAYLDAYSRVGDMLKLG